MAISRLNYTGRARINRSDVCVIVYQPPQGPPTFDVDLRLGGYKLPAEALIFVEAYRQTLWMRFPFGRAGAIVPPQDRRLTDFDSADGILFRVRVTSSGDRHGVMLAEADKIPVRRPDDVDEHRTPLLPVQSADLDQEVCRVDFSGDPVLLVNKNLNKQAVAAHPLFRTLVCPQAMREILTRILKIEEFPDLEDHEDWRTRWLLFAEALPGVGEIEDGDSDRYDDWIESAVGSFARQQGLFGNFFAFWQREENR
ncbi:MAG TPA: hypothetical protein DDY78_30205 [Planctomycetales bacterium]|jgi:hypothetical protein|nr:hypothetical protein [Planctomycetales bacterium]